MESVNLHFKVCNCTGLSYT